MGGSIRQARIEVKMSKAELAEKAYFRQAAILQIETSIRDISSTVLLYLSYVLNKPITYFFSKWCMAKKSNENDFAPLEIEPLLHIRQLDDIDLGRVITIARALHQFAENQPFDNH
jgi:transcriptional regulator with XRE-family HTH domain